MKMSNTTPQGRMMVGGMHDWRATIVTVVVTAIEEAALRCTVTHRDKLWDWAVGNADKKTHLERLVEARSQSIFAALEMRMEVVSIITSRLVYLLMMPHRFAFSMFRSEWGLHFKQIETHHGTPLCCTARQTLATAFIPTTRR